MVRVIGRAGAVVAVTALAALGGGGAAAADPGNAPGAFELPLVCDDGNSYTVIVMDQGRSQFSPGHDVANNTTFVPTMFGAFHGVVTNAGGTVVDEFTEPPSPKGNSTKPRATSISCTYTVEEWTADPDLGLLHFVGDGSVIGFTTPAH
jgi:hypothetical protein